MPRVQPSPRAARKSEWLRSALAHHHCPDPCVDNEIVVLATGIDQYLQEVFHHLAFPNRDDTVSAEDFTELCAVLGLSRVEKGKRFRDVCSGLPCHLSFKDFHSRLCGYFRVRSSRQAPGSLVETQIRVRWPRSRRRKCVSFDLTGEQNGASKKSTKGRTAEERESALRELVEDLRSALQGSDARCLALEVALRRERGRTPPSPSRIRGQGSVSRVDGTSRLGRRRDIRDPLLRELRLIRSSRDGQLEEAIKFNERLEEELRWAYQEVRKLQGVESALRKENTHIRRRAEEAREALSLGLERVRMIQEQAQSVPQLQSRISQLETELHQYRYEHCVWSRREQRKVHGRCWCIRLHIIYSECLQRAVEGKAASDEEEEDGGTREDGERILKETKNISRQHDCDKGLVDIVHLNLWFVFVLMIAVSVVMCMKIIRLLLPFQNVSRRALGKIVTDTLDVCSRSREGTSNSHLLVVHVFMLKCCLLLKLFFFFFLHHLHLQVPLRSCR
uniref:Uncharacterized protein n=1 Tax=Labrus bergylta TaxID=56723 RepID=A0A3Q3F3W9_9LABR